MSMNLKQQRMKVGSRIESASAFSELSLEQDEELQEALLLATSIFSTPGDQTQYRPLQTALFQAN